MPKTETVVNRAIVAPLPRKHGGKADRRHDQPALDRSSRPWSTSLCRAKRSTASTTPAHQQHAADDQAVGAEDRIVDRGTGAHGVGLALSAAKIRARRTQMVWRQPAMTMMQVQSRTERPRKGRVLPACHNDRESGPCAEVQRDHAPGLGHDAAELALDADGLAEHAHIGGEQRQMAAQ